MIPLCLLQSFFVSAKRDHPVVNYKEESCSDAEDLSSVSSDAAGGHDAADIPPPGGQSTTQATAGDPMASVELEDEDGEQQAIPNMAVATGSGSGATATPDSGHTIGRTPPHPEASSNEQVHGPLSLPGLNIGPPRTSTLGKSTGSSASTTRGSPSPTASESNNPDMQVPRSRPRIKRHSLRPILATHKPRHIASRYRGSPRKQSHDFLDYLGAKVANKDGLVDPKFMSLLEGVCSDETRQHFRDYALKRDLDHRNMVARKYCDDKYEKNREEFDDDPQITDEELEMIWRTRQRKMKKEDKDIIERDNQDLRELAKQYYKYYNDSTYDCKPKKRKRDDEEGPDGPGGDGSGLGGGGFTGTGGDRAISSR